MQIRWRGLAATMVAATLAACVPAAADDEDARTVHVRIHYSRFEPAAFEFEPGATVTFVVENTDPIDHEFILGDRSAQVAHERGTESHHDPRPGEMTVPAGATATTTYTFTQTGDLILGCHLPGHYAFGMRAAVAVA